MQHLEIGRCAYFKCVCVYARDISTFFLQFFESFANKFNFIESAKLFYFIQSMRISNLLARSFVRLISPICDIIITNAKLLLINRCRLRVYYECQIYAKQNETTKTTNRFI